MCVQLLHILLIGLQNRVCSVIRILTEPHEQRILYTLDIRKVSCGSFAEHKIFRICSTGLEDVLMLWRGSNDLIGH